MSRTFKDSRGKGSKEPRRVVARGVKRHPIEFRKLSRALLDLAAAQAEAEAIQQAEANQPARDSGSTPPKEAA